VRTVRCEATENPKPLNRINTRNPDQKWSGFFVVLPNKCRLNICACALVLTVIIVQRIHLPTTYDRPIYFDVPKCPKVPNQKIESYQ
jgi:hypothetical protein